VRIAELEGREPVAPADDTITVRETVDVSPVGSGTNVPVVPDEEVETLARDLAETGADDYEIDTPFAWSEGTEDRPSPIADEGATIGAYFDQLLGWRREEQ